MLTFFVSMIHLISANHKGTTMQLQPIRVVANFEPALLAALDEYRRSLPVIPSRAAVLRQAVRALASNGTSTTKPRGKARKARSKS
jgi:hypothetical protein